MCILVGPSVPRGRNNELEQSKIQSPKSKITGTWLDFQHQNPYDGLYWNGQTRMFSCDQWRGKADEISGVGMDTIVIMSTALDDKAFYPSVFLKEHWDLACPDPVEAVLSAADNNSQNVFVSAGFYGHQTEETSGAPDYLDWHLRLTEELFVRYGHHRSFYGWYVPNEAEINGHFSDGFMQFTPKLTRHLRQMSTGHRILIAPYGTNKVQETDLFVDQIQALDVDYIAYQDEVGVRKTQVEQLEEIYARLRRLHDRAGVPLWADVEIFEFEGEVYQSALLPASLDRIRGQLAAISPYVEKILCYQYHGLMNPPNSPQHCGHPDTVRLYRELSNWVQTL
jgi:hypothetical protein